MFLSSFVEFLISQGLSRVGMYPGEKNNVFSLHGKKKRRKRKREKKKGVKKEKKKEKKS